MSRMNIKSTDNIKPGMALFILTIEKELAVRVDGGKTLWFLVRYNRFWK